MGKLILKILINLKMKINLILLAFTKIINLLKTMGLILDLCLMVLQLFFLKEVEEVHFLLKVDL